MVTNPIRDYIIILGLLCWWIWNPQLGGERGFGWSFYLYIYIFIYLKLQQLDALCNWSMSSGWSKFSIFFTIARGNGSRHVVSITGVTYCWWKKSCTTWDVSNLVNNGINYQPQLVIAGFRPSTIWGPHQPKYDSSHFDSYEFKIRRFDQMKSIEFVHLTEMRWPFSWFPKNPDPSRSNRIEGSNPIRKE